MWVWSRLICASFTAASAPATAASSAARLTLTLRTLCSAASSAARDWFTAGHGLGVGGKGRVEILRRQQLVAGQLVGAAQRRFGADVQGIVAGDAGPALRHAGLGAAQLLRPVGEAGTGGLELRARLVHLLAVDAVVDLHQQVALAHVLEITHGHLHDVAADLRADQRDLAAHVGVLGALDGAAEGRKPPRVKHHQRADQRHRRECADLPPRSRRRRRRGGRAGRGRCGPGAAGGAAGVLMASRPPRQQLLATRLQAQIARVTQSSQATVSRATTAMTM